MVLWQLMNRILDVQYELIKVSMNVLKVNSQQVNEMMSVG